MNEELLDTKPKVLIVDDMPTNIKVLGEVLRADHEIYFARSGPKALEIVGQKAVDLILLDIMMPGMDGYEVLRRLKADHRTKGIPVIFITAKSEEEDETRGFELGAVDYITKPFKTRVVEARVKTHIELKRHRDNLEELVRRRTRKIKETQLGIIQRLAQASEFRDNETGQHIKRLSRYCAVLGKAAGMDETHCELLFHASSMHDVGKIGILDRILLKPDKLDDDEMTAMRAHSRIGARLLAGDDSDLLQLAQEVALTHHERWDGTGYPQGLKGEEIPIMGRITAICDVFDALTSARPYKQAWSVEEAITEIRKNAGTHFDPRIVDLFIQCLPKLIDIKEKFTDDTHL